MHISRFSASCSSATLELLRNGTPGDLSVTAPQGVLWSRSLRAMWDDTPSVQNLEPLNTFIGAATPTPFIPFVPESFAPPCNIHFVILHPFSTSIYFPNHFTKWQVDTQTLLSGPSNTLCCQPNTFHRSPALLIRSTSQSWPSFLYLPFLSLTRYSLILLSFPVS